MGCWRNKFLQRQSSNFKEDKKLTVDEIIESLENILQALYESQSHERFPEILVAAENIAGALTYDFGIVHPGFPPVIPGKFEF